MYENKCKDCHHNSGIVCDVKNCKYHVDGCYCSAEKISVGPGNAQCGADTLCVTFKEKEV